ncbi:RadC family protein [Halarsenatibacter silvermanii]|uniref:DNA replication and repair protein RadC n=1 Tax=Halarsenatibacter silvermanii TaxID=321763 RepID=A0A1G9PCC0_9FIRM|nr:DNA repair protein RadC [Halarsenatibacter silvermanii]SDL95795.1 DNA replication and repair protein RadC [Halarsenatibacter silvermanii]
MSKYKHHTVKEMPVEERPREKLQRHGAKFLSSSEILALLLGSGNKKRTAVELSSDLLCELGGLSELNKAGMRELQEFCGIGSAKSARIIGAVELGRRIQAQSSQKRSYLSSSSTAASFLIPKIAYLDQEVSMLLMLDSNNGLIKSEELSRGSLNQTILHPREVFKKAVKANAAGIILAHNHPCGRPVPTKNDIKFTEKIFEIGEMMGIPLLDHIIVGGNDYTSLKEEDVI